MNSVSVTAPTSTHCDFYDFITVALATVFEKLRLSLLSVRSVSTIKVH